MRWRTIPGHRAYEVSNTGIVRRRLPGHSTWPGRVLTPCKNNGGYFYVCFGDGTRHLVHVLVCRAFRGKRPSARHHAAHSNGKRQDNRLRNLRWKTIEQNEQDKKRHGTVVRGTRHPRAKFIEADIRTMRALAGYWSQERISAHYDTTQNVVSRIINRKSWKHVK